MIASWPRFTWEVMIITPPLNSLSLNTDLFVILTHGVSELDVLRVELFLELLNHPRSMILVTLLEWASVLAHEHVSQVLLSH